LDFQDLFCDTKSQEKESYFLGCISFILIFSKRYNMFYLVKLKWLEPKEGTDQMKKTTKQFLVFAESVTEAEMRVVDWTPMNYQDAVVEEVKKTPIAEVRTNGAAETYWLMKYVDDADGREKPKPAYIVLNALNAKEAVNEGDKLFSFSELEELKKFKGIVDSDLISEEIPKKLVPVTSEE
jgi:hypothetical protein